MPYPSKTKKIEDFYKVPFNNLAVKLYCSNKLSSLEIAEKFLKEIKVSISPRHIQRIIKSLGKARSFSEAFNLAIKKGRKSYEHLKKPIKASLLRKGIDLRVLCVLCNRGKKFNENEK